MRLVNKYYEKDGEGHFTLIPEEPEDMWHAYNLIQEGDQLRAPTVRKVTTESSTGTTSSQKVHTTLTIAVESIDYDAVSGALHVKGRNVEENPHVKMGAYHTLDLELNRKFTLRKACWDMMFVERVELACDPTQNADLAAVVMQEGVAHVCLVTASMTIVRAKIDVNIPRKRRGNVGQHEKGLQKFYELVMQAVVRHVNLDVVKCVLVASPGFVKDQFVDYLFREAARQELKALLDNRSMFVLVHASSGFKHSLNEVLSDPAVAAKLADTKATSEVRALDSFYSMLNTEPDRAYYGMAHVQKAAEAHAVEQLLISDSLFRCKDFAQRRRYVALVESVREHGGDVRVFSSMHVTGEQLGQLTGVAALLRFPMPEIEQMDEDVADSSVANGT